MEIRKTRVIVVYDISDDRLRTRIAAYLKTTGLSRVQRSVFIGPLTRTQRTNLEAGLRRLTRGWTNYSIHIYTIPEPNYATRIIIEKGYTLKEEETEYLI